MFALANPPISIGDPIPWVTVRQLPDGAVNTEQLGGTRILLLFLGSVFAAPSRAIFEALAARLPALDAVTKAHNIGIVPVFADGASIRHPAVGAFAAREPALWDERLVLHRAFGVAAGGEVRIAAFETDRQLIVRAAFGCDDPASFVDRIVAAIASPPRPEAAARAPVLVVPGVLNAAECRALTDEMRGGETTPSGYMLRHPDGKYYEVLDAARKSRTDHLIPPGSPLYTSLLARLEKRVFSLMRRQFQFEVRGIERLLLACYAAGAAGHFAKHRDYSGPDYHREFGITINLNDGFGGGELSFPEFGEAHKPGPGDAIVYSGALMHQVEPVTSGERYCLLSFLMGARGLAVLERYEATHGLDFERRAAG
jgi:hypothetical protein